MNKLLSLVGISLFLFVITGCATRETKIVYITKTKTKFNFLPKRYYVDNITLPKPPNKKIYLLADPIKRNNLSTNLILELYKTIGLYKIKLRAIKNYETKIKQGVEKINKKEKAKK